MIVQTGDGIFYNRLPNRAWEVAALEHPTNLARAVAWLRKQATVIRRKPTWPYAADAVCPENYFHPQAKRRNASTVNQAILSRAMKTFKENKKTDFVRIFNVLAVVNSNIFRFSFQRTLARSWL